ncbi:hypothetical protein J0664_06190 [Rhizobium leguminosarum]|uniref:hypothetical protein n=1 Tax=Rhizobium leguminosarum TaxID=384 RepID=UPI001A912FA5|nr:hypothetical protein [Rhizobium leguminosarum]MBY5553699.1 hypothetical protein [Rhizobium leguminosarum]QSW24886.1 hypothetical protein J0664_06190 [Rhizobium leguminosarum]
MIMRDQLGNEIVELRDKFAIAAMAAIISLPTDANAFGHVVSRVNGDPTNFIADLSYSFADAMLAARTKES